MELDRLGSLLFQHALARPDLAGRMRAILAYAARAEDARASFAAVHGFSPPSVLFVSLTSHCELSCVRCGGQPAAHEAVLPIELLETAVREAVEFGAGTVILTGGEPLAYPHLFRLVRSFPEIVFLLFTNGLRIDPAGARELSDLGNVLTLVSVEGWAAETDACRGAGVGLRAEEAIAHLSRARALVGFSSTVDRANLATFGAREFYGHMGATGARLGVLIEYLPAGSASRRELCLRPEERRALHANLERIREASAMPLFFLPWEEGADGACRAGREMIHFDATGAVTPCPFLRRSAGMLGERPLADILSAPLLVHLRGTRAVQPDTASCGCFYLDHAVSLPELGEAARPGLIQPPRRP